ncbi:MAG: hypothetical protein COA50_02695 [Flavobacteriaceae bacterium]|nr:MAG: hypothetical protein COA50_02695 [Flavobacteriaceae bacterium]
MVTFFSLLLVLLGINAILLIFSVNRTNGKVRKTRSSISKTPITQIYPINLAPTNYKKAI